VARDRAALEGGKATEGGDAQGMVFRPGHRQLVLRGSVNGGAPRQLALSGIGALGGEDGGGVVAPARRVESSAADDRGSAESAFQVPQQAATLASYSGGTRRFRPRACRTFVAAPAVGGARRC
jgi:hypothetical protein